MTEIAVNLQERRKALAAKLGAGSNDKLSSADVRLPELKIMNDEEDSQGNKIKPDPRGKMFLKGVGEEAYADSVSIRPLSSHIQYIEFNDGGLENKSCMIESYNEEARDIKGTIACGHPMRNGTTWEEFLELPKDDNKRFRDMEVRQIRALVTMAGKTADGAEVEYVDQPCIMFLKGSKKSGFWNQFHSKLPKNTAIFDFNVELTTKFNKNGSVKWYTYEYNFDKKKPIQFDDKIADSLDYIAEIVDKENDSITKQYFEALKPSAEEQKVVAAKVNHSLEADFKTTAA